jgi:hypothetical protein
MSVCRVLRRTQAIAWSVLKVILFLGLLVLAGLGVAVPIGRIFPIDPPPPTGAAALVVKRRR